MRDTLLFLVGLLTGAILAAFFTPKSGTELRGELLQQYEHRLQELNQKMEQLQAQIRKTQENEAKLAEQLSAERSAEA